MVNLRRIHQDFARITCDNVDPGECQSTVTWGRIPEDFARITCDNVDPGWSIDGQLCKMRRIHQDFARITCDNVDPGECQSTVTWGRIT